MAKVTVEIESHSIPQTRTTSRRMYFVDKVTHDDSSKAEYHSNINSFFSESEALRFAKKYAEENNFKLIPITKRYH